MKSKWNASKRLSMIVDQVMQLNNHATKRRDAKTLEIAEKIEFLAMMDANFLEANADKFSQESFRLTPDAPDTGQPCPLCANTRKIRSSISGNFYPCPQCTGQAKTAPRR